jgi:hypothetical protein
MQAAGVKCVSTPEALAGVASECVLTRGALGQPKSFPPLHRLARLHRHSVECAVYHPHVFAGTSRWTVEKADTPQFGAQTKKVARVT